MDLGFWFRQFGLTEGFRLALFGWRVLSWCEEVSRCGTESEHVIDHVVSALRSSRTRYAGSVEVTSGRSCRLGFRARSLGLGQVNVGGRVKFSRWY